MFKILMINLKNETKYIFCNIKKPAFNRFVNIFYKVLRGP